MAGDRRHAGHQYRSQPHQRRLARRLEFGQPAALKLVRKLHNQNAVLGHKADERHESHLGIDVQRCGPAVGPEGHVLARHFQEAKDQGAENRERHGPGENDQRIAEAVELRREHEKDQHDRQAERGQELVPFNLELPRLAGVINLVALRQNFLRLAIHEVEHLAERTRRHAAQFDGVELLEAVQRTRPSLFLQRGERAERHQFIVGPLDVRAFQLTRIQARIALQERNHLVAQTVETEPVHEISADERREVSAHRAHVQPERRDLVPIQHQFDFRLVNFGINQRREVKHVAAHGGDLQRLGKLQNAFRLFRAEQDELDGKLAPAGQRRRGDREGLDAGNLVKTARLQVGGNLEHRVRPRVPRREHQPTEAAVGKRDLERLHRFRRAHHLVVHLLGVKRRLINGRVGGALHEAQDETLIFHRREFFRLPRHREHDHRQEAQPDPNGVNQGPRRERGVEHAGIQFAQAVEAVIDLRGQTVLLAFRAQKAGRHHRRQRQRHDAGDANRARQRQGEFSEERARQPALKGNWRVNRRERDRHRDHRADEFPRAKHRSADRFLAFAHMPLHVFDNDDGVVHHETDGEHHR